MTTQITSSEISDVLRAYYNERNRELAGGVEIPAPTEEQTQYRPSQNEIADNLIWQMHRMTLNPGWAYGRWEAAYERLQRLRSRAYSIPPVRYDKDRVQSSNSSDLSDTVDVLMAAEQREFAARMHYLAALASLDYVMDVAEFDPLTARIWHLYYSGLGYSMETIASQLGITRARVRYALERTRNSRDLCMAINYISENLE